MSDTSLLFRSVRAARSWVDAAAGRADAAPAPGCVVLKPGNDQPPVFMIPGAAGSILQLAPLAAALDVPMPAYAIKPRGLAADETPCGTLAEMAEHATGRMTAASPQGPYLLVGYSAGGLVALEAAQQLVAGGHDVALVVLLDTYPSRETWSWSCHLEILCRQAVRACWALRHCTPARLFGELCRRLRSLLEYLSASGVKLVEPPPIVAEGTDPASRRVHLATYQAGEAYRPGPYAGRVVFIQPDQVPNLEPRRPERVWSQYLKCLTIRRVPGSHLGMMQDGAAATAAQIARCIGDLPELVGPRQTGRV